MKKIFFLATAFCLTGIVSKAQTQKGYYLIGGNIASMGGNTNEKSFNLQVEPKAAWFIQDDLAVGGQINLGLDAGRGRGPAFNYFVGPMARYYFGDQQVNTPKQTRLFAEANAGIGGTNGGGRSNIRIRSPLNGSSPRTSCTCPSDVPSSSISSPRT